MDVRTILIVAVVGALGLTSAPALAQSPLPQDNAGTGQYIESVPDAGGARPAAPDPRRPAGSGQRGTGEAPSEEGRLLERIASDPGAGATAGAGARPRAPSPRAEEQEGAASGLLSAVVDSDSPGTAIVLLAALGMTLAGFVIRRRRAS